MTFGSGPSLTSASARRATARSCSCCRQATRERHPVATRSCPAKPIASFFRRAARPRQEKARRRWSNCLVQSDFYPLAQKDSHGATKVIRVGGVPMNSDWPKDVRFFEYLADGLSDTPVEEQDKLMYAMIEPLGLAPGKPLPPDERQQRILAKAAETARRWSRTWPSPTAFPDDRFGPTASGRRSPSPQRPSSRRPAHRAR